MYFNGYQNFVEYVPRKLVVPCKEGHAINKKYPCLNVFGPDWDLSQDFPGGDPLSQCLNPLWLSL